MKKSEMIKYFGYSSATLDSWDKGTSGSNRKLLYEVLMSLPVSYVIERAGLSNIDLKDLEKKTNKSKDKLKYNDLF